MYMVSKNVAKPNCLRNPATIHIRNVSVTVNQRKKNLYGLYTLSQQLPQRKLGFRYLGLSLVVTVTKVYGLGRKV